MLIRLFADSRAIEIEHTVDWHEKHRLAKINYGPDVLTRKLTCDTSAGYVERDLTKNTTWQQARFEVCHHKWCDMSQTDRGLSVINEGKYGVGLEGSEISLSLLRATIRPDISSDMGRHSFCQVLLPHAGGTVEARTNELALEYNVPLRKTDAVVPSVLREAISGIHGLVLQALKLSEDGKTVVVRLSEQDGRSGRVTFPFPVQSMNLLEDVEGESRTVKYRAFELLTVGIRPENLR